MEILGALTFAMLIIFGASQYWRLAIKSILIIVVIEGALRRWAFPQARDLIYFFKDFVLISSYIGFYINPRPLKDRYPLLKKLSLVITVFCCLQLFNPSLGSPIIGLLGIRAYLLYIPLVWIVPHLFSSKSELLNFFRTYLLILIPVCILGIVQYFSPPDSFLNVYITGEKSSVAMVGDFVRITGTFAYIFGLTVYLAVCFSLLIILISQDHNPKWQLIYLLEIALVLVNSFMTGARVIIIYEILFVIGYFIFLFFSSYKYAVNFGMRIFLPILLSALFAVIYFQPAIQSFSDRATNSDSVEERIVSSFTQVYDYATNRIEGYGVGATQGGADTLRSFLDLPNGEQLPPNESETGRVVIEIGLLGFILWYGLRILLMVSLYSVFRKLKDPFYKELALAILLFQGIYFTGQLVTNPTMLIYFWFFNGFIYLLPNLEEQEIELASTANAGNSTKQKNSNLKE